jgi:carboxypeptidase Q
VTASSRAASAILILLLVATVVVAATQSGGLDADVARLTGRILADTPAMQDLRELTDGIGGRLTGTPACERAVDWAVAKFKAAGVDAVATEPFTLPNAWIPRGAEAGCVAPVAFPLRVASAPGTAGTPGGKPLEAKVVDAGDGGAAAWAALGDTARGAIAVVRNPEMHTLDDLFAEYMSTPSILDGAKAAGVAAVLLQSSRPRGLLYRHPMSFAGEAVPTPVAVVSREHAERMLRLLTQGPVRARVAIDNSFSPNAPSRNVVADIRGSSMRDEIVLVGAHLDSFELGTGANDNGVSCAEVIDLARQIKASGLTPRRTIRFVLFTAEEQGMIGSRAYVAAHAAEMGQHAAAVIYDIGSGKLTGIFLNGREDVRPIVDAALARVGSLGPFVNPIDALDGTDNFDFLLSGVPNFVGFQDPAPYLPDYHAESDTFDKVDAREAKAGEAALASLVWELANAERLPPRQTRAEVDALIKATALEPQMKAFAQWDDWTAGRRGVPRIANPNSR